MYSKQEQLRFHARTVEKLTSIWFQLWSLPMFRSHRTEIRTIEPQDKGMHFYPIGLSAPIFAAMIRGIEPVSFTISTGKLDLQLGLMDSTLYLYAWDASAEEMLERVKNHVLGIATVSKVERIALAWEYYHIMRLINHPNWMEILAGEMRSTGNFRWIARGDAVAQSGDFPAHVTPDFLLAGDGESFICYDRENDRLAGGTAAPDIWQKMKRRC